MRVLVFMAALAVTLGISSAARAENWSIYRNCNTDPCTIGVALPSYNEPGWDAVATYAGPQEAWAAACELHFNGSTNFSPDIAEGRVNCSALSPDPNRRDPVWVARWSIFRNCSNRPCMIGVALPNWNQADWSRVGTYRNTAEAWIEACKMHFNDPNYYSPDILAGRVDCGALSGDNLEAYLGVWSFGRENEGELCKVNLTNRRGNYGLVLEACHPNESFWEIHGNQLLFRDAGGTVSTSFTLQRTNYWSGPYLLEPSPNIVHYLTRGTGATPDNPCPEGYNPYGCN